MPETLSVNSERRELDGQSLEALGYSAVEAELVAGRVQRVEQSIAVAEQAFPQIGPAQEAFALKIGNEVTIPVINYSERALSAQAAATIAKAAERVSWVVGPSNADQLGVTIAITPGKVAVPGSNIRANADRDTRIIRIAEEVFDQDLLPERTQEDYGRILGGGRAAGEEVLVHELGHVVEFAATGHRTDEVDPRVVKDFFGESTNGDLLSAPPYRSNAPHDISGNTVKTYQDGEFTEMTGSEAYGTEASVQAPTAYARKSPGEYFAESFTGYAYGGEVDTPLKDMVQATINTQLTAGKVVAGPVQPATFERIL